MEWLLEAYENLEIIKKVMTGAPDQFFKQIVKIIKKNYSSLTPHFERKS